MHPDRRRAGRAIRKQQREARERLKQWEEFAAAASRFGEALVDAAQRMMVAFGPIVMHFSRARGPYWMTTQERNQYGLTPGATATEPAEAGTGDPSQTGVASLSEAHSAFQGITPGESIYDEPWAFDDEDDRR